MNKISVIIHTYNNENIIRKCLESVKDFDEIIVCDMYSNDKTLSIAKEYNCKIVMHKKIEIVEPARNFAISQASNEWVLIVDSDEIIPEKLKEYLYNFININNEYSAVKIPRRNFFWGHESEILYPDYVLRFAKKSKIEWQNEVHSQPKIDGSIYTIHRQNRDLAFIHNKSNSISETINAINKYTDKEVEKYIKTKKHNINMLFAIWKSFFLIFEKFFLKKGYKNGIDGLILSILFGFYKFLSYTKYYLYIKSNKN